MKLSIAALILIFSATSFAGENASSCRSGENKFAFSSTSEFGGRIFFENLQLCLDGKKIAIIGKQRDFIIGYVWRNYTTGLCKALGLGATISTEGRFLSKPERLARFDSDGKFSGVELVKPWRDHSSEIVLTSLTCDSIN